MPMKFSAALSRSGLLAALVARPGSTHITIRSLEDDADSNTETHSSTIDFLAGEVVRAYRWLTLRNPLASDGARSDASNGSDKKRKRKSADADVSSSSPSPFIDYLVILLETGEILIHSTATGEFTNKISTDSPFSSIEVIHEDVQSMQNTYDIITFDQTSSSIKLFSSSSPQLVKSIPFKKDASIEQILYNAENNTFILASPTSIYILDSNFKLLSTCVIQKAENSQISQLLLNGEKLYISHTDGKTIQIIDISISNPTVGTSHLSSSSTINSFSILLNNVCAATLSNGSIDLFQLDSSSSTPFAHLDINGGAEVGKFISLYETNSAIVDQMFKCVWYDNFKIKILGVEFEDITTLNGNVKIDVLGDAEEGMDDEHLVLEESEEEGEEEEEEENEEDDDVQDYQCQDLATFSSIIRPELSTQLETTTTATTALDDTFIQTLAQNVTYAKPFIHSLTVLESNTLLCKCAYVITNLQGGSTLTTANSTTLKNMKEWIKWILILRGSVITLNEDCVGWLKLLHSELRQEAKLLPNLVKLTGKLALLKDQLQVRSEMMNSRGNGANKLEDSDYGFINNDNDEIDDDFDEEEDGNVSNGNSASVVLDGEGGYDEDDDEEEEDDEEDDVADESD